MMSIHAKKIYDKIPGETLKRIKEKIYTVRAELNVVIYQTEEPVPFEEKTSGKKIPLAIGETWGKLFDCAWFHFTGIVPDVCQGQKTVLLLDVGGEGCIYDEHGNPQRGITTFTVNEDNVNDWGWKRVVPLFERANGGEKVDFWVDCGYNDLFGNFVWGDKKRSAPRPYREGFIATVNEEMRALYYDYLILDDLRKTLSEDTARYASIMYALLEVKKVLQEYTPAEVARARKILKKELSKKGGTPSLKISAVGHSHLDLAWLWPIRETKRKAIRTFATQLEMIRRYPDYVYGASQPQQFEWIKQSAPDLYERIKSAVAQGRIEPQGCMWVESDTNIPCGESLVRQIFYGKQFFKDEFGKEIETLWLPDVFGFSAALPQLCAKSDVKYLCTIKLSWNWVTKFPYHSFIWQGISDDSVLVHMPPEGDYNSMAFPANVQKAVKNYQEKGKIENALMLYGIGDGGAGPAPRHLESLKRIKNLDGLPPVQQESSSTFFKKLEKQAKDLETYKGEMYLEAHQGTYTSQGDNKKHNKALETLLHDLETAYAIENKRNGTPFPQKEVDEIWKEVLLYQFHDILPGSSIQRVYKETEDAYCRLENAVQALLSKVVDKTQPNAVFNSLGFAVQDVVERDGTLYAVTAKPLGYTLLSGAKEVKGLNCRADKYTLSNDKLVAKFNDEGVLVSIVRKRDGRNVLTAKGGNLFSVYHDECSWICGDAWDIDPLYYHSAPDYFRLTDVKSYMEGACAVREQTFRYGGSTICQKIKLKHSSEYLEFDTTVDWQETNKMLRADFHTDLQSDFVTCGIQFGNIKRTTKENTETEKIQFEICAQRYAQLCENNYKFAVMSDCKFGYRAKGGLLSLNLLRSPEYPAAERKGIHTFRYGVYCGENANDIERISHAFGNGIKLCRAENEYSFATADRENVLIDTLKPAYDGQGQILRVFECNGQKTTCKLTFGDDVKQVTLCNLLEKEIKKLPVKNGAVQLTFKAFEIHTLRVE